MVAREMLAAPGAGFLPVAFVDDDPARVGTDVEGLPVAGGRGDIPRILHETGADEILIALPSVHGPVIREIIGVCRDARVRFRIVPGIWEIIRGNVHIDQIRSIEPEDLLGRETVEPDQELLLGAYRGKRILVTGGGGSIGRELARQALSLEPERVVLVGRGENSLFESRIALEQGATAPGISLLDIRRPEPLRRLMRELRPHVVLHAAAHKHVTFMELHPEEAVLNNLVATRDLVNAAAEVGVDRFVMLSTDKAVYPRSVMGATKRLAELLLLERTAAGSSTRLVAVRFGNVLGSRGSVVRLFLHQIRHGLPLTVSHPDAARFFMTLKEAALLVLEAGARGEGGEIFILDMGEQIRILDLARDLVTLSGLRSEADVSIEIRGLGPGEKLREELLHRFETLTPTGNPKIGAASRTGGEASPAVESFLAGLEAMAEAGDRDGILQELTRLLPEASLTALGRAPIHASASTRKRTP
jgi:FlaA1/EpsC-like NDP-sugar epimerase